MIHPVYICMYYIYIYVFTIIDIRIYIYRQYMFLCSICRSLHLSEDQIDSAELGLLGGTFTNHVKESWMLNVACNQFGVPESTTTNLYEAKQILSRP